MEAQEAIAIAQHDDVLQADKDIARQMASSAQLAAGPRIAMQAAKRVIDRGLEVDLETGLELERAAFSSLFATEDRVNGMQSFIENGAGKATFTGR